MSEPEPVTPWTEFVVSKIVEIRVDISNIKDDINELRNQIKDHIIIEDKSNDEMLRSINLINNKIDNMKIVSGLFGFLGGLILVIGFLTWMLFSKLYNN